MFQASSKNTRQTNQNFSNVTRKKHHLVNIRPDVNVHKTFIWCPGCHMKIMWPFKLVIVLSEHGSINFNGLMFILSLLYMFASSILGMLFLRGAYFGPRRTSAMELFANIVYGFLLLTIFTKSFVIDVWQDLNPLNVKMIKQTQKSSGPFCGVGPKRVRWASGPCLVAILFFL